MEEAVKDVQVGYPEELSIFEKPAKNLGIKQARCITYYPVNDFSSQGVIQFRVNNNSSSYLDLSKTRLNITCKIVKGNGEDLMSLRKSLLRAAKGPAKDTAKDTAKGTTSTQSTAQSGGSAQSTAQSAAQSGTQSETQSTAKSSEAQSDKIDESDLNYDICYPVNNIMHSLFSRVDLSLQDRTLSNSDDCYPYEAYIKTLLMTTDEEKRSLESQGYFDEGGNIIGEKDWYQTDSQSLKTRGKLFDESKEVDLTGNICSPVMNMSKLLPYGIGLAITLHPSKDKFCLLSPMTEPKPDYKIVITKASLSVCTVEVAPEIAFAHSQILETTPAIFPYNKIEVKKFTLSSGIFSSSINDPFQGRIPSELIIGLVKDSSQNGSYDESPFKFEHANLNFLSVTVDGKPMGIDPIQPKYGDRPEDGSYMDAYRTLNGVNGDDKINPIRRMEYPNGRVLYRFHEEFDKDDSVKKMGNMTVSFRFDKALERGMCVIMHATFPSGIKVDKSRAVHEI